jgi:hypothetical protein
VQGKSSRRRGLGFAHWARRIGLRSARRLFDRLYGIVLGRDGDVGFLAKLHLQFDAIFHHGGTEFTENPNFFGLVLERNSLRPPRSLR